MLYIYRSYGTMIYTVATTIMPLRPYITAITMSHDIYLQLIRYSTYRTNNYYSGSILQQLLCIHDLYLQLLRHYDLYRLNNYYSGPILQQLLCLHDLHSQLLRLYEPHCRNHYYVTKAPYHSNYYVSMTYIYSSLTSQ